MTHFEDRIAHWLSLDEAMQRVLEQATDLGVESLPIDNALGRILAQNIHAPSTLPPLDNSAMDGYAVRSSDLGTASEENPFVFDVVGVVHAGGSFVDTVGENEAVRIMTGGSVPKGADTIVRVEDTDREQSALGKIAIFSSRDSGRNVRPSGEDWTKGTVVLKSGQSISPRQIALLAATRTNPVPVFKKPTVAVLSSGNELEALSSLSLSPEKIPESNSHLICASVKAAGAIPKDLGIARDNLQDIEAHIKQGREADVLITVGGASMGEGDLFKSCLDQSGFLLDFWRAKIRPGSPVSFGQLPRENRRNQMVFGLPGNPSSAMVTFEILVRPFLLALAGSSRIYRPIIPAHSGTDLKSPKNLTEFPRVKIEKKDGHLIFMPAGPQGSGLVSSLSIADALAIIPEGVDTVSKGKVLNLILLHDSPGFYDWSVNT
jgi:molybdopterin molybdotransferase